ncbi:hypothetical protein D1872_81480 [compost metagenome]
MTSLDHIYREPSSLIMSGVESDSYWDIAISAGVKKLLVSYHYIQKKGKRWIRERLEKHPDVKLMIDSGAYTFHMNEEEYRKKPMEYWEKYIAGYTKFIRENRDIIFSCVEIDIANIVGEEVVEGWRNNQFRELEELGVLVCYVWHPFDGKPAWEKMCKRFKYVGYSLKNANLEESDMIKMANIAKKYGALIHGFAITRVDLMSRVPFYTGDSTTWLVGTQYGELNWFDGRTMKRLKKAQWKRQYKMKFIKLGANWELAEKENPYELIRINLLVFLEAEKYIRNRIRAKQYWMKGAPSKKGAERPMPIFRKSKSESSAAPAKKPKLSLKKGAQQRDDLAEQGKSKLDEFLEATQESAPKKKLKIKRKSSAPKRNENWRKIKPPSREWFDGDMEDYEQYAEFLNISLTRDKDEILDLLWEFYVYLTPDEEELSKLEDQQLFDVLKFYTEEMVSDREEAIQKLKDFYLMNATGQNDTFSKEDEDIEAPPERPKERESYLTDDNEELVDVAPSDLEGYGMLPPGSDASMEEVEAYDAELRQQGIVAIRDEKGRFLKGQKVVRKPKQIYSKHFPKLACNTCYKAGECPEYKPDHACAFEKLFQQFDTRNTDDILDAMAGMTNMNLGRMMRLAMFEQMDGGMPDPALTAMIDQNMKLMASMKQLMDSTRRPSIVAQQTTRLNSDGTQETTTTVHNPADGILAKIFGNPNAGKMDVEDDNPPRKQVNEEVIDID